MSARGTSGGTPAGPAGIRQITAPGPELDAVYEEILLPSFAPDELSTLEELGEELSSGRTSVWVSVDAGGRPVGTVIGEWDQAQRIVLLAWAAIRPGLRGTGIGGPLLRTVLKRWRQERDPCLILTEVNDPAVHPTADEAHGDPVARLRFYRRLGARTLELPYFQAALGRDRERVDGMLLLVLHGHPDFAGREPDTVDGAVLRSYLEGYQLNCEGAIATDDRAMRLWRAVDRPGGVPLLRGADAAEEPAAVP
ncbi:GNAT family N-acetyltransferase [Streptomyces sp. N2-109]|uniref:GNAT family N-acetyltransferase n=1 Tax=Streptomyces gossypii TaxID=2883101 RepID=A0ABT2JTC3_9ACTN|nr:GNAT family N-acetyltransferase [Streptomyces gossypii]MCT2590943.1 GNAT family N-acetyltransferase [Streptomyces gossypii]